MAFDSLLNKTLDHIDQIRSKIVKKIRVLITLSNLSAFEMMALGRGNVARSRNSWGPMSVPSGFHRLDPDEEFAEEYTERMMSAQMRQLDPLKEDLAEWLNKNLGECIYTNVSTY